MLQVLLTTNFRLNIALVWKISTTLLQTLRLVGTNGQIVKHVWYATAGAEPDSASEGVDTAVGEASQIAKTGSTIKTQRKTDDPKVCMLHFKEALPSLV